MKRIFFIFLFFFSFFNIAFAQFFVNQAKVNIVADGGDTVMGSFDLQNTTKESISVKVYWEDFDYVPPFDGTKDFLPSGTGKSSAGSFVVFSPQEFELPPFGQQNIEYIVKTPLDFQQGHYGVIFFERAGDPIRDITGVQIVTRLGTLFFVEPKNALKTASFDAIHLEEGQIKGDFINQSKIILIPQTSYYILDAEGNMLDRNYLRNLYLPPGEKSSWEIAIPNDLSTGVFTLMLNAELGDGDITIQEVDFSKEASGQVQIKEIRD